MPRTRALPPLPLHSAHRAPVRDPDVDVEQVPPNTLDAHRPLAYLSPDDRAWAARLAAWGRGAGAAGREAEVVVVDRLEVPAPCGVAGFDGGAALGHWAAGDRPRGGGDPDGQEGVGERGGHGRPGLFRSRGIGVGRGRGGGRRGTFALPSRESRFEDGGFGDAVDGAWVGGVALADAGRGATANPRKRIQWA